MWKLLQTQHSLNKNGSVQFKPGQFRPSEEDFQPGFKEEMRYF